MLYSIYTRN